MAINYRFGRGSYRNLEEGAEREWFIGNGLGGFSNISIIGNLSHVQSGYLVATLNPPVERINILSNIFDKVTLGDELYDLSCQSKVNDDYEGFKYLESFELDSCAIYTYRILDAVIKKTICIEYGKNTVVIKYEIKNGNQKMKIEATPLFGMRDNNETDMIVEYGKDIDYSFEGNTVRLSNNKDNRYEALFYSSDGIIKERKGKDIIQEKLVYLYDIKNGYYYEDTRISPFDVIIEAEKYETKSFYFKCTIEELDNKTCDDIIKERRKRDDRLVSILKYDDEYLKKLALCADGFIVDRRSTGLKTIVAGYPWFSDWGRDTMIALQGMTLCTQRFDDARDILLSFAKYVNNGLLPNRFASNKEEETLYNTVDASMWYFYSVYKYLTYTGKKEDYDFVKENLYPVLKQIIEAYKNGTDFSIKMQDDYLISAGGGFDQVTWMDVRVGEWVVTPRHGKPVEINALWYNALKVMEELARYFKEDDTYYRDLAEKVKKNFVSKFWNEERQCLFDVVDENDEKIRPNQIWAISLPFTMLDKEKEKKIINTVMQHLYTPYGLRTLSYEDKEFKSQYIGKLEERDAAYHMGTAWPFLLGGFITAYCKTNDYSEKAVKEARDMLLVAFDHLNDGCINGYSEVFDGINPITGNGCYNQAWSVGELLRSYYEDVLLHTKNL